MIFSVCNGTKYFFGVIGVGAMEILCFMRQKNGWRWWQIFSNISNYWQNSDQSNYPVVPHIIIPAYMHRCLYPGYKHMCLHPIDIYQSLTESLTLFWLGFFMYVKCSVGDKITPLSKILRKDDMKLKFTPQLGNHKTFQKNSKKNFWTQFFRWCQQFFDKKWPKIAKLGVNFKIL